MKVFEVESGFQLLYLEQRFNDHLITKKQLYQIN